MKKNTKSFEEQFKRLEEIVSMLDSSESTLEEQLKSFEEGMDLVASLRQFLEKAEQTVIDITKQKKEDDDY